MEAIFRSIGLVANKRTTKIMFIIFVILLTVTTGYFYTIPLIFIIITFFTVRIMVKASKKVLATK